MDELKVQLLAENVYKLKTLYERVKRQIAKLEKIELDETTREQIKQRIREMEEKGLYEVHKIYLSPTVLDKKKKEIVDDLVEIQQKMNELKSKLEELKAQKKELEAPVIEVLEKLKADGIQLEKALIYLKETKTIPSFWQVYEEVESKLKPDVDKLLRETYSKLTAVKEPSLVIKAMGESINEEGFWRKIVEWFKSIFAPLYQRVSSSISKISSMLGVA